MVWRASGLLALAATFCVTACAPVTSNYPAVDTTQLQSDPSAPLSEASARSIYANRTMITFGPHGTQIEYHKPNGTSFLWYPGNQSAVPAAWKVEMRENGHSVCWKYPSSSFNPLTQQAGGKFECSPDFVYFYGLTEVVVGDPFRLASGALPFPLPKDKFDAAALARLAKIPSSRIKTIYRGKK